MSIKNYNKIGVCPICLNRSLSIRKIDKTSGYAKCLGMCTFSTKLKKVKNKKNLIRSIKNDVERIRKNLSELEIANRITHGVSLMDKCNSTSVDF